MNEVERHDDPETGLTVTRWTDHPSNHLYFTNPGWFDDDRQLVFSSDQDGVHQLAILDLMTGDQRQLTKGPLGAHPFMSTVDPINRRVATWVTVDGHDRLDLIDLDSGVRRGLYDLPPGWQGIIPNVTADGRRICCGMMETPAVTGFADRFEAQPSCKILAIDCDDGAVEIIHERDLWLGHVNTAPNRPDRISFCHEGPWTRVEHRVWCCDLNDGRAWKVHPDMQAPACIGHEYWLQDGRRIAYHGFDNEANPVLGIVDVEDDTLIEHRQPVKTKHSHSLDGHLIVGDGSEDLPWILGWYCTADELIGPFKICHHGGGWSDQRLHVHPRVAPDGRSVLFTSDLGGFPRVYSVGLPDDLRTLPLVG